MQDVGYFEAWAAWWQGPTQHLVLWGHSILFWGRLGKVVQFVAALAIVVEILGPQRLRSVGVALKSLFIFGVGPASQKRDKALVNSIMVLVAAGSLAGGVLLGLRVTARTSSEEGIENVAVLALVFIFFAAVGLFLGGMAAAVLIVQVIAFLGLFVSGAAWTLEQPNIDKVVKVISAALLIAGFHFDLLAS